MQSFPSLKTQSCHALMFTKLSQAKNRTKILHTPKEKKKKRPPNKQLPFHYWSRIFHIVETHENKVLHKNQFSSRLLAAFISHWRKEYSRQVLNHETAEV